MERSHLQPQVVFQHRAKIEGESQTLLEAKLLSTTVLVLYTSVCTGTEGERERDRKEKRRGRAINREKTRSRSLRSRMREWRTISLSIITKTKMLRLHRMPSKRVRCDIPPASSREQNVKKKQG